MQAQLLKFVPMAELPNRIRELRKAQGLTLEALGAQLGCSLQMVGQLERGDSELTLTWMKRIARALGVQPADLLLPEDNSQSLSPDERVLIEQMRAASPEARDQLAKVADVIAPFRAENGDGKRRA